MKPINQENVAEKWMKNLLNKHAERKLARRREGEEEHQSGEHSNAMRLRQRQAGNDPEHYSLEVH